MTAPHVLEFAAAIAYELDGWEARPCHYGTTEWAELHGPAGDVIQLRIGPRWIEARGIRDQDLGRTRHWNVAGYRDAQIGFSAAKTPARMAGEIRRRLLPTVVENNRLLDAEATLVAAEQAADDALFAAAKALFGSLQWWNDGTGRRQEAVAFGHTSGIGIKFRLDRLRYDVHSSLTLSNLTRAEMLALIRAAAALRNPPASRTPQRWIARRHARRRRRAPARARNHR